MAHYRFILSGGGTGGHIYPAIAIADELKSRYPESEFLFVGASDRMEMDKVPEAGYKIEGLWISGIQRKITLKNLAFPFKLVLSLLRSRKIIKTFQPNVVIGTGGFASGPLLQVAASKGIPCLIQEQNSYPGITNKLLAKKVAVVCVAYEGLETYFPKDKIKLTGNPVRQDLLQISSRAIEGKDAFGLIHRKHTLLVLGGSLGAKRINQLIEANLDFFAQHDVQVIWQCGKLYYEQYKTHNALKDVQVHAFIKDMALAYAAADIIISRAGAISVSELCIVGKPVIFIPSPNVAEDHQTKNAQAVADKGAAVMLKEQELDEKFQPEFAELLENDDKRKALGNEIRALAKVDATKAIVDEIEKLLNV
jgi:UDP-N-acetylglucosamine--N-acetylmuramyl-(pentapeptide) pyrophosphoryl-undecaprenol N-acetylglucosamine transferase